MTRSKRLHGIDSNINRGKFYDLSEAVSMVRDQANANFDETVEIAVALGIDPKYSDQVVRGIITLPHGTGRKVRVAVFANGDKYREAEAAGADIVGSEDLAERVQDGHIDFDYCIATPDMMNIVGKLGKVLGPRGLMPNPKLGTLTFNVSEAVQSAKAGQVQFRSEKSGIIHAGVGKISFLEKSLIENIRVFYGAILKSKPSKSKGSYIRRIFLSSTMGVSFKVNIISLER